MSKSSKSRSQQSLARHRTAAIAVCVLNMVGMVATLALMVERLIVVDLEAVIDVTPFVFGFGIPAVVGLAWLDWAESEMRSPTPTGPEIR